jgi:hypothetical protein
MNKLALRRSFAFFHATLAVVIFLQSIRTIWDVQQHHAANPLGSHLALLAGAEALAALLFLIPRTLRAGGVLLLLIFGIAIIAHGITNELGLIVYAAGVVFVMVHGSAFSKDILQMRIFAA